MNYIAEINQYDKAKEHILTIVYICVCVLLYTVCVCVCLKEE